MALERLEHIHGPALHRRHQQPQEVQQGQAGKHPEVGRRGLHLLHDEAAVVLDQLLCKELQRARRVTDVADEEIGKDGARDVVWRRVRLVLGVPGVEEVREGFGRGGGADDEVLLGLVNVVLWAKAKGKPSANHSITQSLNRSPGVIL